MTIRIFEYISELDCFVVNTKFKQIADQIGLTEWSEVVWIGRFFAMDNDYGEHWFDNWTERDELEEKARKLDIKYEQLLVINPERFKNDADGPCHTDAERKKFWADVLKSLELSLETIISEAIKQNNKNIELGLPHISGLDKVIENVKDKA